jgi:acyl-CoA reductase-like NAD-dependent aldehyde dehydrogenase
MKIRNPANGSVLTEVEDDDAKSVAEKYRRARAAQLAWSAEPLNERLSAIQRFRDAVVAQKDELALTLTREMGKPITQSKNELAAMPGRLDFFLNGTAAVLADERVRGREDGGVDEIIAHEPLGVIANISAWNYPWFVGSNVYVPALLTGNTVLYKPSEYATMTGLAMAKLLHEAGIPENVFIPVIGARAAGEALLEQKVDSVFFTGSHETGRAIASRLGPRMLRLQLELGGKDPTYVCEDVDVKAAAESLADGAMYNAGQSCCSVERIYVHESIADAFETAFADVVRGFRVGDPEDKDTYIGPLAREAQVAVLSDQIEDAVKKGGRVLVGGGRASRPGPYFQPTVVVQCRNDMRLMREESFGPVIGIGRVSGDEEAIERMNDTDYGLTAGVYTPDQARAASILSRIDAGTVYWNCCDRVSPRLPWTGRRQSGMGSTLSTHGIRTFLRPKAWHLRAPV